MESLQKMNEKDLPTILKFQNTRHKERFYKLQSKQRQTKTTKQPYVKNEFEAWIQGKKGPSYTVGGNVK
jgi:hypothetical protein